MLKDVSTRIKLMLLPITFIGIVIISALVFSYFNSISEKRINTAIQTDLFIQQVLKGRISVYQFLRVPSEQSAQKVKTDFKEFDKSVSALLPHLSEKENIDLANEILVLSEQYISNFDKFYGKKITEYNNGIYKEGTEVLSIIKEMVQKGLKLEEKLAHINENAMELKLQSEKTMSNVLIAIAVIAIVFFVAFSILLSNQLINSINNFQKGL